MDDQCRKRRSSKCADDEDGRGSSCRARNRPCHGGVCRQPAVLYVAGQENAVPARRNDRALKSWRRWQGPALAVALLLPNAKFASAKDLVALAELVVPAYTAMNVAVVCATRQPAFLSETGGPLGNALEYAEHVKDEAIESLAHEEALIVLKSAADAARATVLQTIRRFYAAEPNLEAARIRAWCSTDATDFIRTFMNQHDRDHDKFLEGFKRSKR